MKRRARRYDEGGNVGYEENPQPGMQSEEETERKKPAKKTVSRTEKKAVSEDSPKMGSSGPSTRGGRRTSPEEMIAFRADAAMKRNRARLPSDRATGFRSQAEETGMTPDERAEAAREGIVTAAMMAPAARGASLAAKGLKTAKRRYDIGRRVDAMTEGQQKSAFLRAAREAREVDGMKSGGRVKRYASGGSVSSASKRADGIASKGKTRGKFV